MTRRLLALALLLAAPLGAQVSNPSSLQLMEEGVSLGPITRLNCIGAAATCAVTSGLGSITITAPTLTGSNTFTGSNTWNTGTNEFSSKTNISGPGATTNVEIGSVTADANAGSSGTTVAIGSNATSTAGGAQVIIGNNATAANNNAVVIGIGASSTGNPAVAVGQAATAGSSSVAIGGGTASAAGASSVAVGAGANAGAGGFTVAIGNAANAGATGTNSIVIGSGGTNAGVHAVGIGYNVNLAANYGVGIGYLAATTGTQGIAIGPSASAGASEVVLGGAVAATPRTVYLGYGLTTSPSASATSGLWTVTSGSGTNIAGASLTIGAGRGTGTARAGDLILAGSASIGTGTTLQTHEPRARIVGQQFALVDNTATTFAVSTLGNDTQAGGTIGYCVYAADATTAALECGSVDFAGVDVTTGAGGEVCATPTKHGTPVQALSGSTLAVTFSATTGTDLCNWRVNADTNIATPVSLWIKYAVTQNSGAAFTPQ